MPACCGTPSASDLGGDRVVEPAAGGKVCGLQHAVDCAADGGAVAALVPGREFQVAGVFGESGVGRLAEPVSGGRAWRRGLLRSFEL